MTASEMKEILRREYGINSMEEFEEELKKTKGIDISMFVQPIKEREKVS